ncbi:DUF234 domain-containing protein [Streptomyces sp. NPDC052236]|uniref:DUF234 domain-containing protein n=1 Tax=Streptomyces sp. NPDC052236 TaxID=3365686 RepID=UPI0037D75F3B
METVDRGWTSWRGRAVEPVVREALRRLLPDERWPDAREIGGWWPRTNNPEADLVAADRSPARKLSFAGSIKWLERGAFGARDLAVLARDAQVVPGADAGTPLVAVSRSGFAVEGLAAAYGA